MLRKLFITFSMILTAAIMPVFASTNAVPNFTTDLTRTTFGPAATMRTNQQVTYEGQRQSLTNLYMSEGDEQNKDINFVDNSKNGIKDTYYSHPANNQFLYNRGVNDSKTIYKDDLGRLHFFRSSNIVKE